MSLALRNDLERKWEAYDNAYLDVMEGRDCDFWPRGNWQVATDAPRFDGEQYVPLFVAIKTAASLVAATPEDRWRVVADALRREAEKYANSVADEA
jgi:hypothetical protein